MSPSPRHRREAPSGGWASGPVLAASSAVLTVLLVLGLLLREDRDDAPDDAGERRTTDPAATATLPEAAGPTTSDATGAPDGTAAADGTAPGAAPAFDTSAFSVDDPASPWVVVNKVRPLVPLDHRPATTTVHGQPVAPVAADPLARLVATARAEGVELGVTSGFRSYERQAQVHGDLVGEHGRPGAEALSARPGHSEHQTGLAVDVIDLGARECDLRGCFKDTPAGRWVAAEAWRFGWVVRYGPGQEAVTGYAPEPWHLRYVGVELATELRERGGPSLEEFFGLPGGDYPDAAGSAGAG